MEILQNITFILYGLVFVSMLSGLISTTILYRELRISYPEYYKSIGEPKAFAFTMSFPTSAEYDKRTKGTVFIYSMLGRGIPKDFPKNLKLRRLANVTRYLLALVIVLFVLMIIGSYLTFGKANN